MTLPGVLGGHDVCVHGLEGLVWAYTWALRVMIQRWDMGNAFHYGAYPP